MKIAAFDNADTALKMEGRRCNDQLSGAAARTSGLAWHCGICRIDTVSYGNETGLMGDVYYFNQQYWSHSSDCA